MGGSLTESDVLSRRPPSDLVRIAKTVTQPMGDAGAGFSINLLLQPKKLLLALE
jgi:hypothetical protein